MMAFGYTKKNNGLKLIGIISLLMAVMFLTALTASSTAWAGFSDMPDNHWAAKDISTLDKLGIIGGYTDGTFKPNQAVEQTEAICLVVRAMGLKKQADAELPQVPFAAPKWAETDMQLATQGGILQSTDNYQANTGASRAFVARLLVRMIGKENEAKQGLLLPSFTDANQIPDWAKHYVRVAQDSDLIAGYVDKTFRPNREVSRSEMVAFLYRAMQQLPGGSILPGVDGSAVNPPASTTSPAEVVIGTVVRVYPESNAVVVENSAGVLRTLYLPGGADVTVIGSAQSGLNALQIGDKVQVELGTSGYITKISVTARGETADLGVVYELDANTGILTMQLDNARLVTYYVSPAVTVKAEGVRFPALQDIKKGDRVKVTVQNNLVSVIELLEIASNANGKVILIDQVNRIINLEIEGRLQAYKLPANVKVDIKGLPSAYLSDIMLGDMVLVHVRDGQVETLEVTDRNVEDYITGTVVAVDAKNRVLTVKKQDGKLIAYEVHKNARVVINNSDKYELEDFKKDMEVKFRLLDNEIIYVATDNSIGGTIISLDTSGLIMVFQRDSGERKTYIIDKNVDVTSKDKRDRLGEVKRGDYAHILVSNDRVVEINLRTVYTYTVDEVREAYDRIDALDADGKSERLNIRDGVNIVVPGNNYASLKSVRVGDTIQAVYAGSDLKTVEVMSSKRGEIAFIDAAKGAVQLKLAGGGSATVYFKGDSKVESGSKVYDTLKPLAVGDRVEVAENQAGTIVIKVMESVLGKLATDGDDYTWSVYLVDGTGMKKYNVHQDVAVRDINGYSISLSKLKNGQQVRMYLLWNRVCEIQTIK